MIEIYHAHPGPYSLAISRRVDGKKIPSEVKGPFLAHAAHENARTMVSDPAGNITDVFVYSEKEHQFIGAMYFRGQEYTGWSEEEIHALAGATRSERTADRTARRERRRPEPVRESDAGVESGDGDRPGDQGDPVRVVRSKARDRFPAVRGTSLTLGTPEGWPPSKPAQIVREWFAQDGRTATVAEVVQALGPALADVGMQFPAALVSRLKQKGLLKETA